MDLKLVILIMFFKPSDIFGDVYILINKGDDTNYYKYQCGMRVLVQEGQELTFNVPNEISQFRCYNADGNLSLNMPKETLQFKRFYKSVVNHLMDGQWSCDVYSQSQTKQECYLTPKCLLTIEVEHHMTVIVKNAGETYTYLEKHAINEAHIREGNDVQFECTLPGVMTRGLDKGTLNWRHCRKVDDGGNGTICVTDDPISINNLTAPYEASIDNNNTVLECVYKSKLGVETIFKLLLVIIPLSSPVITADSSINATIYEGNIGDEVVLRCNSTEQKSLQFYWIDSDDSYNRIEDDVIDIGDSLELSLSLTEDLNDTTLICSYKGIGNRMKEVNAKILLIVHENCCRAPPNVTVNGNYLMMTSQNVSVYFGLLHEEVIVRCHNSDRRPMALYLCRDDDCLVSDEVSYTDDVLEYKFNLTEEFNETAIDCAYTEERQNIKSRTIFKVHIDDITVENPILNIITLISVIVLFFLVILAVVSLCRRRAIKKNVPRPRLPEPVPDRPPENPDQHIYYTIDYGDYYSYARPNR